MLTIEDVRSNITNGKYDVPSDLYDRLPKDLHERVEYRRTVINPLTRELKQSFKTDLFDALDISNHPNCEKLFTLAWEYGHSSGYGEVLNYADDLADLLK